MGEVAAIRNDFERTLLQTCNHVLCLELREDSVVGTPDDEHRHLQLRKLVQQHLTLPFEVDLSTQRRDYRLEEAW